MKGLAKAPADPLPTWGPSLRLVDPRVWDFLDEIISEWLSVTMGGNHPLIFNMYVRVNK